MMNNIQDIQIKIREILLNDDDDFLINPADYNSYWNAISALDLIDDTATAILIWEEKSEHRNAQHLDYIFIHGFLQCLHLQQDSVIRLAELLGIKLEKQKKLTHIREIRNKVSGHPMKQKKDKRTYHTQISRASLSYDGFQLIVNGGNDDFSVPQGSETSFETEDVHLGSLVKMQSEGLEIQLKKILKHVETVSATQS